MKACYATQALHSLTKLACRAKLDEESKYTSRDRDGKKVKCLREGRGKRKAWWRWKYLPCRDKHRGLSLRCSGEAQSNVHSTLSSLSTRCSISRRGSDTLDSIRAFHLAAVIAPCP